MNPARWLLTEKRSMNGFRHFILAPVAILLLLSSHAVAADPVQPTRCERSLAKLQSSLNRSVTRLTREYKAYLKVSEKTGRSVRFDKELAKQSGLLAKGLRESIVEISKTEKNWKTMSQGLEKLDEQWARRNHKFQEQLRKDEARLRESFAHLSRLDNNKGRNKDSEKKETRLESSYQKAYKNWLKVKERYKKTKAQAEKASLVLTQLRDLKELLPQVKRLLSLTKSSCLQESRYISESLTLHMDQLRLKKLDQNKRKPTAKKLSKKQDVKNLVFDAFCSVQKNLNPILKEATRALHCLSVVFQSKEKAEASAGELREDLKKLRDFFEKKNMRLESSYYYSR